MKLGAKYGSSKYLSSLKNWEIYAKTGTVQVCTLSKKNSMNQQENDDKQKNYTITMAYLLAGQNTKMSNL